MNKLQKLKPTLSCLIAAFIVCFFQPVDSFSKSKSSESLEAPLPPCLSPVNIGQLLVAGDTVYCQGELSPQFYINYIDSNINHPNQDQFTHFWVLTKVGITPYDIVAIIEDDRNLSNLGRFPGIAAGNYEVFGLVIDLISNNGVLPTYSSVDEIIFDIDNDFICADIDTTQGIAMTVLDCPISVSAPCSCRSNPATPFQNGNATNDSNGQFNETVKVEAFSGQTWFIKQVNGFFKPSSPFSPSSPIPFQTGQALTESPLGNGMSEYTLEGIHVDAIGYSLVVENLDGATRVIQSTKCYYPDVTMDGWSYTKKYCENSGLVNITGGDKNGGTGLGGFTLYQGNNVLQTSFGTTFSFEPGLLPQGDYRLEFTFDAQAPEANNISNPGCSQVISETFSVVKTPVAMACNNNIWVSLAASCESEIEPDFILEGSYGCYDDYEVSIFQNNSMIPTTPIVTGAYIGQTLMVKVTHLPSGNRCWGAIGISDNIKPQIDCGGPYFLDCTEDPATVPSPTATDGCDPNPLILLVGESTFLDACGTTIISKTYKARDYRKNTSAACVQEIHITQADLVFPEDITWTCEQYAAFPSIVSPEKLHDCLKDPSIDGEDDIVGVEPFDNPTDGEDLDVPLIPDFDDNIDNPLTDPAPNTTNFSTIGNPSAETDNYDGTTRDLVCNLSTNYAPPFQYFVNTSSHIPDTIKIPNYLVLPGNGLPVRGLEDADVLAMTGSGVPNLKDSDCPYNITFSDKKLQACPGQGKDKTFKILRTWTAYNYCTGVVKTEVQTIKVIDNIAPTIIFGDDFETELVADQFEDFLNSECSSSGRLDVPTYFDNCSGITELRVFSAAGEGIPVLDGSGNLVGFRIPPPYLPKGNHDVTYQATDGCGNMTSEIVKIKVIDGIPPIPICRELTQISLTSDDIMTTVAAANFDVGSYDNCGEVYFKIRRLDTSCPGKGSDQNRFNDEINFCCEDIGDTTKVILRVFDLEPASGIVGLNYRKHRSNDCEVEVLVSDYIRPECIPPADVWTTCQDVADNLDLNDLTVLETEFGAATATDNCEAIYVEKAPIISLDMCGSGTITRSFFARDIHGNRSVGSCIQTIMIQPVISNKIHFPGDYQIDCMMPMADTMTYEELGCDLLARNIEDLDFFGTPDGSCKKILRTYRVINWCNYDGWSDPVQLPRLDLNSDGDFGDAYTVVSDGTDLYINNIAPRNFLEKTIGYVEYTQHVKVFDGVAPELLIPDNLEFCGGELDENPCTGYVSLLPKVIELCTPDYVTTDWELDLYADGSYEFVGQDSLTGRYVLGHHRAKFSVSDDCGNRSEIVFEFDIIDCKAPTPVCHQGLAIDLSSMGTGEIWASDFNASSFDYCHPIKFKINRVTDRTGDGFITADDYVLTPPTTDSVQFTCTTKGTIQYIQFWVGEESSDNVNNWDFCTTFIEVQDNFDNCGGGSSKLALNGAIKMENDKTVGKVMIEISGGQTMSMMTSNDGNYAFTDVESGSDFTITPYRDDDHKIGISTIDIIQIQRHLLNVEKLDSPYKMIAADANNSESISTLDLIVLRKIVLRTLDKLPNNTAWRFIPKDFVFQDRGNPWAAYFPELMSYNNVTTDMNGADFVAIKIGDVNLDVNPTDVASVDNRSFENDLVFETLEQSFDLDERVEVSFKINDFHQIRGCQFTIDFDENILALEEMEEGLMAAGNFGLAHLEEGKITVSWDKMSGLELEQEEMFTLIFSAKEKGILSQNLTINSALTPAESYATNGDKLGVVLDFEKKEESTFFVKQNYPNPFSESTTIEFGMAKRGVVNFTIFAASGKVLKAFKKEYAEGENQIVVEKKDLRESGVYFCRLETEDGSITKKIMMLNSNQ